MKKTTTEKKLKQAEKENIRTSNRVFELRKQLKIESEPAMRMRIGECYKYRNSWGGGQSWWFYARIVGVRDGEFQVATIERPGSGAINIDNRFSFFEVATRITSDEFRSEVLKLVFAGMYELLPELQFSLDGEAEKTA